VATKKLRPTLSETELLQHLDDLIELDVVVVDVAMTMAAVKRHYLSKISFYDALVIEAAIAGGARVLYSEDLQHGQVFDTVEIVNPFL
jgi:predicted nucleic acid-binding protein